MSLIQPLMESLSDWVGKSVTHQTEHIGDYIGVEGSRIRSAYHPNPADVKAMWHGHPDASKIDAHKWDAASKSYKKVGR